MIDRLRLVFSGEYAATAAQRTFEACTILLLASSFIPGSSIPNVPILSWDKAAHVLVFLVYALLLAAASRTRKGWGWITLAGGSVMGIATEWLQSFAPGRDVSGYDFIANVIGVLIGIGVVALVIRGRERAQG